MASTAARTQAKAAGSRPPVRPPVHKALMTQGLQPQTMTSAEFARFLSAEIDKWTEVARKANLKPE